MLQLLNAWNGLTLTRKIVATASTVGMFLAIMAMARLAAAPSMSLLYAGLDSSAAGEVVRSLETRGVAFEVRGASIFVDNTQRDELRMTLASEGLPANGSGGYELLDGLSGFGTTSQMFDAAYWRAKEGELARTIVANPNISSARVHIANTSGAPFQRDAKPTASVAIGSGRQELTGNQVKALKYLVASAVAGLSPDDVAVIGGDGALLGGAEKSDQPNTGDERADLLKEKVERLLEARVGTGNAVVEVSVDTVLEREAIRERVFDPEGRVAISTDTEETVNSSSEAGGGQVSVASNLPDGDGNGGENSNSQNNQTRERINYEISETEREIVRAPGAIKRLTVAVLVNNLPADDAETGSIGSPRSEEELGALRELVESAVGFDENRGDVITLKSMALTPVTVAGTEFEPSWFDGFSLDIMSAVQMIILAVVTLILGLFVVRPIIAGASREAPAQATEAAGLPDYTEDGASEDFDLPSMDDIGSSPLDGLGSDAGAEEELMSLPSLSDMQSFGSDDPAERLRNMIEDRQAETVEILRGWLEDKEEVV